MDRQHTYCLNCGDSFGRHSPDPDVHPCDLWSPSTLEAEVAA